MNYESIEEIEEKLKQYPDIQYQISGNCISLKAKETSNFEVSFAVDGPSSFTVSFEGWHETFEAKEEALNCFGFGMGYQSRLIVLTKGDFPYRWILEVLADDKWTTESEVGLIIYPFWRKTTRLVKQNNYRSHAR